MEYFAQSFCQCDCTLQIILALLSGIAIGLIIAVAYLYTKQKEE